MSFSDSRSRRKWAKVLTELRRKGHQAAGEERPGESVRALRRAVLAAAVGVAFGLLAAPAQAVPVSTTAGLIQTVAAANGSPGLASIELAPGTYNLTSQLVITDDLDIIGTGSAANTVIRQTGAARVLNVQNAAVTLGNVTITGGNVSGNGGGILVTGTAGLTVEDSAIEGNRATASGADTGGGGIYFGAAGGTLIVRRSSVSGNRVSVSGLRSGGGGIWSNADTTIESSTLSGNVVSGVVAGGGGYLSTFGAAPSIGVDRATFADNTAPTAGAILGTTAAAVPVTNSIVAGSGAQCAGVDGNGENIDSGSSCTGFNSPNTNPSIGGLANNGGGTRTRALAPGSPAIDGNTSGGCPGSDQRDVNDVGASCDLGAYEFDGLSVAQVPNCSPTGLIPLGMSAPPGFGVVAFHYRLDGVQTDIPTPGGGTSANTTLNIPEGRRTLEFWGEFTNDPAGEKAHHTPTVLVDKTDPTIAIRSEQRRSIYVITRKASVDVNAGDGLSGLVGDPSANGQRISTRSRGSKTFSKTATDLCGNQQADALKYQVLGPKLGTRTVLEKLRGTVKIRRAARGSAARAAQKGRRFVALRRPREIPVGSFINTKRGTLRLTSSKSRRATAIQDGEFSGGLFQVLQSRRKRAKGLTELRLKGSSFRRCRVTGKGARASLSRRRIRRLRARAKGRFRTRGRYSAATVRGTNFTVIDRCDGTLTKVTRGRVAVRDFRRKRTIILKRGRSYLAKAPVRR